MVGATVRYEEPLNLIFHYNETINLVEKYSVERGLRVVSVMY
jgi:hypothetical protein